MLKMKPMSFTFLALFNCCLFAQTLDPYKFFPSSVGNVWEYRITLTSGIERYEITSVSNDTNNNKFVYFGVGGGGSFSYKIDTSYQVYKYPFGINWLYYKLDADSGDHWTIEPGTPFSPRLEAHVKGKFPAIIFGRETIIMKIIYYHYVQWFDTVAAWGRWIEYLAYGIGNIMTWDIEGGPEAVLRGCIIDGDTIGIITSVNDINFNILPFELFQNYPNPFNTKTTIKYSINEPAKVKLIVYSLLGEEIKVLVNEYKPPGIHSVVFDASDLPSGIYIYSITTGTKTLSKKLILLK
jgi:hypothetical protein